MNNKERGEAPVLDRIATSASQHVRETAGQLGEMAARATEGFEESLDSIGTKFSGMRNSVIDTTRKYSRSTDDYVARNPWTAIAISSGFAFLMGMLIGRRRG